MIFKESTYRVSIIDKLDKTTVTIGKTDKDKYSVHDPELQQNA